MTGARPFSETAKRRLVNQGSSPLTDTAKDGSYRAFSQQNAVRVLGDVRQITTAAPESAFSAEFRFR